MIASIWDEALGERGLMRCGVHLVHNPH